MMGSPQKYYPTQLSHLTLRGVGSRYTVVNLHNKAEESVN